MTELATLTGLQAQRLLSEGKISALELTEACLARIAAEEPRVQIHLPTSCERSEVLHPVFRRREAIPGR